MKRMNVRQRTALPQTSGVRASAWRALAVVACAAVALAVSLLCARNARADGDYQDVWNHQSLDGGQQYIVGAWNAYDAAAFVCGYSHSAVSGWDLPILAKLSNAPAIVALADSFGNVTPWNDESLAGNCEGYFGSYLWSRMSSFYAGTGGIYYNPDGVHPSQLKYWQENMPAGLHVYALNTTGEAVGAAKEAFRSILAGESSGGGGGSLHSFSLYPVYSYRTYAVTDERSYGYTTLHDYDNGIVYTSRLDRDNTGYSSNVLMDSPITVTLPDGYDLPELPTGYSSDCIMCYVQDGGLSNSDTSKTIVMHVYLCTRSNMLDLQSVTTSTSTNSYTFDYPLGTFLADYSIVLILNGGYVTSSGVVATSMRDYPTEWYVNGNSYTFGLDTGITDAAGYSDGQSQSPEPPNNWPDDDTNTTVVAPSPPELPTPTGPSLPTEPTDDPPVYYTPPVVNPPSTDPPTNVEPPTGTDPTDYTPWLRAILLALNGISSDLSTHCLHLQNQMIAQSTRIISGINNQLVNLGDSFNGTIAHWAKWLGECLGEGLNTLTDNLYDLFHWLAEQFDFTFSGDPYDDSGIIGWLRRIYNRLGSGGDPKHYAPTILDPGSEGEEEPFDFWAWLLEKIASILGGVLGGATDAVTTLLDGIKGKFPFSIPWDIMAILGLLSGNRAIPVFTFTIPAIQGWWSEVPIRVDLTPYDSAATACRTMVLIWWALVLAMKSTWMVNDVLGAVSSGIVARFTGRLVGTAV